MDNIENKGWLAANMEDPEFRRLLEREEIIETFLNHVDEEMKKQGISRAELARRMGCKPANVTQIMRRTRNLTVATMVDIAYFLGLKLQMSLTTTACSTDDSTEVVYTAKDEKERDMSLWTEKMPLANTFDSETFSATVLALTDRREAA